MKFRVWDKKLNQWDPYDHFINEEGELYRQAQDLEFLDQDYFEICYAPGIKDKNEKLLYAGNIVRFLGDIDPNIDSSVDICQLIYDKEDCCFYLCAEGYRCYCIDETVPERIEYIGNKYENPELLK